MDNKFPLGIVGLITGGLIVWAFMSMGGTTRVPGMMQVGSGNVMGNSEQMDAHFIEQMIPHHEDAITMANLALEKSQRTEIKQLAQEIVNSQSAEIAEMKAWYQAWYGREVADGSEMMMGHGMMGGGMHMGMMGDETDLGRLAQADDFDRVFIEEMIPHHQMAVMMANMLARGSQRPEMQQLAQDIIKAQTSEIEQMRQWYQAWF